MSLVKSGKEGKRKNAVLASVTFIDTSLYLLSLALALSIHNKLQKT
jgi:hypothetical protein